MLWGAAALGRRRAVVGQAGYLFFGALGLPFFSGGAGGIVHLLGPTGGYLLGFVIAAGVVGELSQRSRLRFWQLVAVFGAGAFIILLAGTLWLSFFLRTGLAEALLAGMFPFIPGDILKVLGAAVLYGRSQARLREIFV